MSVQTESRYRQVDVLYVELKQHNGGYNGRLEASAPVAKATGSGVCPQAGVLYCKTRVFQEAFLLRALIPG